MARLLEPLGRHAQHDSNTVVNSPGKKMWLTKVAHQRVEYEFFPLKTQAKLFANPHTRASFFPARQAWY